MSKKIKYRINFLDWAMVIGVIIGTVTGSFVGFSLYSWFGLIVGVPIGFYIGGIFFTFLIYLFFLLLIEIEILYHNWKLKEKFGKYWSNNKTEKWIELSSNITFIEKFEGRVIYKFYDIFLDTNHGFPVLIEQNQSIKDIDEINIGDTLSVFMKSLDNDKRFIIVSQKPLDNGVDKI